MRAQALWRRSRRCQPCGTPCWAGEGAEGHWEVAAGEEAPSLLAAAEEEEAAGDRPLAEAEAEAGVWPRRVAAAAAAGAWPRRAEAAAAAGAWLPQEAEGVAEAVGTLRRRRRVSVSHRQLRRPGQASGESRRGCYLPGGGGGGGGGAEGPAPAFSAFCFALAAMAAAKGLSGAPSPSFAAPSVLEELSPVAALVLSRSAERKRRATKNLIRCGRRRGEHALRPSWRQTWTHRELSGLWRPSLRSGQLSLPQVLPQC